MSIVRKTRCPLCAEAGRDERGNNLAVYADGGMYCHAGHGKVKHSGESAAEQEDNNQSMSKTELTPAECMQNPEGSDPARKIPEAISKLYGTRIVYDGETGQLRRVYYPYCTEDGTLQGVKIRNVQDKKFFVAGKLSGLFGKHACKGGDRLIVTEGEEDALAMRAMFPSVDCVSVPNGANLDGKLDAAILSEEKFFRKYPRIAICLDNDEPGRATAKRLAAWLSGFVDNVRLVLLPLKDASDCLLAGMQQQVSQELLSTKQYRPEGIVVGKEIKLSDIMFTRPKGLPYPWPELEAKMRGSRDGEITTICAGPGIGKSTLVRELGSHFVQSGLTVAHISLEHPFADAAMGYLAMELGLNPAMFLYGYSKAEQADAERAAAKTFERMYFFKHDRGIGSVTIPHLLDTIRYYARAGAHKVILDHLSMVVSGSSNDNERKEIDRIMTELASIVVETGVELINVVHLKRREEAGYNAGGEITLSDLRGSSALEQLSWNVIALERNQQAEDGSEDYSTLRVLKNRVWGRTGRAGKLRFDHPTGRLVAVQPELPHSIETPPEKVEEQAT